MKCANCKNEITSLDSRKITDRREEVDQ